MTDTIYGAKDFVMTHLIQKITEKSATIGILGLGYVGLPLAVEFAQKGFQVTGLDVQEEKVTRINRGESDLQDVRREILTDLVEKKRLHATRDFTVLKELDVIIICVPTPLNKTKDPDMSFILSATNVIKESLRPGQLIVLESTTYPGTTEEILLPSFESEGLTVGTDFYLAFSPERIDPGNKKYGITNTPKVVGGVTKECLRLTVALYQEIIEKVVPVSSPRVAEMVKLLENTFRTVNVGLVNEMAMICDKLGIDIWEVIEAASTKPFGFIPFYPGPGLGGHCLPIDPHYLSWKLKMFNYHARFIELASNINTSMPQYVVEKITEALNRQKKSVSGSRVLILGVTYKRDVNDIRESPSLDVILSLQKKGAVVSYNDPYVPVLKTKDILLSSVPLQDLSQYDCVAILTDHSQHPYAEIVKESKAIVDTRNATGGFPGHEEKIMKL